MGTVGGRGRDCCQPHQLLSRDVMLAVVAKEFARCGYHGALAVCQRGPIES